MRNLLLICALAFAGCDGLHTAYVKADEDTYTFAESKLQEWAGSQEDEEWVGIVDDKLISWKARIQLAKKKLEEE